MIQDLFPQVFDNQYTPRDPKPTDYVLSFRGKEVLIYMENGVIDIPKVADCPENEYHYLHTIDDDAFYLPKNPLEPFGKFAYVPFGKYKEYKPKALAYGCVVGESFYRWYRRNQFCGQCGSPMEKSTTERAMVCPKCGFLDYPKICPAIIVAVCHGDKVLLTKYAGREFTNYALIAGFAEVGETIEETVHREVLEEVGVHVKDLRFYKSQPWPFSDSLLMGFFAKLDGDEHITLERNELSLGEWTNREDVPPDTLGTALTAEMMDLFRRGKDPFSQQ